ncbi:MAG: helix-turn-helix transcriptional regulator [bacterium]|nr:helix-turn-helix transcriptional regulator [bacterium]
MLAKKVSTAEKKERKVTQCGLVIGGNLQRILDREGVSQSDLVRKLNTQPGVINEICNEKRNVSINRLDKIRAILGVDCYEFLMPPVKPE